jgi:RND family efflux transporter MFP subunit
MGKVLKVVSPFLIILLALGGLGLMVSMKKPPEKKPQVTKALLVDVMPVMKQDLNHLVQSQGTVNPKFNTVLISEVNGRVIELSNAFVAGGFFSKGDLLVRIDPADYETAVKSSQANVARAEATLQEEKARAKVAEKEWQTFMQGDAPQLYLRKPQLARELANVRSAQADLERAMRDLERTSIRAPFDGMVKQKATDFGQFVTRGTNLGTVYGTSIAEVRLPLTDNDLAYVDLPSALGQETPLKVTLSAFIAGAFEYWEATIVRSEGVLDEKSRVTYVVAQVADPYGLKSDVKALSFGRFVQAKIEGHHATDIVILPRHQVTADGEVLVVEDGKIFLRKVSIVRMDEENVYIENGLNVGEQYVTSVIPNPINGLAVRVSQEDETQTDETLSSESAIVKAGL